MFRFLSMMLICSVSASAVTILLHILSLAFSKRYTAKWQYYSWVAVISTFLIPVYPSLTFGAGYTNIPISVLLEPATGVLSTNHAEIIAFPAGNATIPDYVWVVFIWLAGAISVTAWYIIRHIRFVRLIRRWNEGSLSDQTTATLTMVAVEMGIAKAVKTQICPLISSPVMIGFLKPHILLPNKSYTDDEMTLIIKHELTHYKRGDLWGKAFMLLVSIIHWFNPFVYLAAYHMNLQCELSCDEAILAGADTHTRQQYSKTILDAIPHKRGFHPALSTSFYHTTRDVKKRIASILNTDKKKLGVTITVVLLLLVVVIGGVLTGFIESSEPSLEGNWTDTITSNRNTYLMKPLYSFVLEHRWLDTARKNKKIYLPEEPFTSFMGGITITYDIKERPSWLLESQEHYWMTVSAYDVIVIKGVDFQNETERDYYVDDRLESAYMRHSLWPEATGSDVKPDMGDYSYTIEFSENLSTKLDEYSAKDYLRTADEPYYLYKFTYLHEEYPVTVITEPPVFKNKDIMEIAIESIQMQADYEEITLPADFAERITIEKVYE